MGVVIQDGIARVLAHVSIGRSSGEGIIVRMGVSTPLFRAYSISGLSTPTPMGWWTDHQLARPPIYGGRGGGVLW